jgi:hypothetical protein
MTGVVHFLKMENLPIAADGWHAEAIPAGNYRSA